MTEELVLKKTKISLNQRLKRNQNPESVKEFLGINRFYMLNPTLSHFH